MKRNLPFIIQSKEDTRVSRKSCSYNYADLLRYIPEVLENVPLTTIRKFARKSWRYMDAYNKGLEGRAAEWAINKYKSHRRLPENIENIMKIEFENENWLLGRVLRN